VESAGKKPLGPEDQWCIICRWIWIVVLLRSMRSFFWMVYYTTLHVFTCFIFQQALNLPWDWYACIRMFYFRSGLVVKWCRVI
jgi:hypothetical protein